MSSDNKNRTNTQKQNVQTVVKITQPTGRVTCLQESNRKSTSKTRLCCAKNTAETSHSKCFIPQMTNTSKVDPKISQLKGNEKSITLNDILVALTNVMQTLANIPARMDKLEINQTKSKNTSQKIKKLTVHCGSLYGTPMG
ncbi:Hypothetical protein CINCED_3A013405 [Cinara cedri]|uniref:Uncharacterized protein n=1 Tax=Cinara cedri TaxID=506608 RepID=A0A5E4N4M0_9HEMI|nr:Hypothetical protein CINCED_3A013405 [Cinara cedri]